MAAEIAAMLTERGLGGDDPDLRHRLDQFRRDRSRRAEDARAMAKRWSETAGGKGGGEHSPGALLALAYPDRIAKNRGGGSGAFLLANGRGGNVDPASALAREPFLAVAELTGSAAASRIVLAAPIALAEIEARFADRIEDRDAVTFDAGSASLRARRTRRLGALVLAEQVKPVTPDADTAHILAQGIIGLGLDKLPWSKAALQFRHRVGFLRRAEGDEWPDLSNEGLARNAAEWLEPLLAGQDRAQPDRRRRTVGRGHESAAVESAPPARRRGADAFHRADRLGRADRLRGRAGADRVDPRAGTVRARRTHPCHRRRPRAAGDRAVCRRRTGRCR